MSRLQVKYDDDSSFSDISNDMENYLVGSLSQTIVSAEDKLYLGYRKPISEVYIHLTTVNTNSGNLSVKYYNGSSYTAVSDLIDRSEGFTQSNFIRWERDYNDQEVSTVDGVELYWYELTLDADSSAIVIAGINLNFSHDDDIREEEPTLLSSEFYPASETSYIAYHQAARNEIIQKIRNEGHRVTGTTKYKKFTQFDLHDREELRQASKYLVMSKIYFNLSDEPDDKYYQKHQDYRSLYGEAVNLFFLSWDKDDDGKTDNSEEQDRKFGRIIKL